MATPAPAQASSRTGWGNSGSAFRGGRGGGGSRRGGGGRRGAGSQRQGSTTTTSTPATPAPASAPASTQAKPTEKASSQADKPPPKAAEKPSPAKAAPTPTEKTPSTPSQPKGKRARGRQGSANTTTSDANSVSTASFSPAQGNSNGRPQKANSQAASPAINGNAKKEETTGRRRNPRAPRSKPAPLNAASLHPSSAGSLAASQSAPNTSLLTPNASLRHNLSLLVEHARSATPGSASHIDWANEEEDELPDLDDWAVDAKKSDEESAESHDEVKADVKPKGLSPGAQMDLLISPIIVDGLTSLPDLVIEDANVAHPKATNLQSGRLHPSLPKKPTLGVLAAGPQDTIRGAMPMRLGGAQATGRKGAKSPGPASKSPVAQVPADRSLYSSMHAPKPAHSESSMLHAPKPQMPKPPVLQEPVSEEPLFPSISNDFILNTTNSACPSPAPPKSPNLQTEEHYDSHASKTSGGGFGQNGNGHHRHEFTGNHSFGGRGGFGNGNGNGFRGGRGGLGHTLAGMTSHPRYLNGNRGGRGGPRGGADFGRSGFTSGHKPAFSDEMGGSTNESGHARTHSAPNGAQPQQHKRTTSRPIITGDAISRLARTIGGNVGLGPREERDKGQGEKVEA